MEHIPYFDAHCDTIYRCMRTGAQLRENDGHLDNIDEAMKRQQMYKTEEGRAMLKLQEGDTHHGGCGHCGGDK